jgi:ATP-dependent Clp protease ATP-binding subunit ClpA
MSAREIARELFEQAPQDEDRRRMVELCGLDPDAILAELAAQPVNPPVIGPNLQNALDLASDDAFRLGQSDVRPENLLFGLLRSGGMPQSFFTRYSRIDLERFYADVRDRVQPTGDRVQHESLPMHADAQAAVDYAIARATERRHEHVNGLHLLYALMQAEHGVAAETLARYGADVAKVRDQLERDV